MAGAEISSGLQNLIEGSRDEELILHRRFKHLRLSREWFRLGEPLEGWIDNGCRADFRRREDRTAKSQPASNGLAEGRKCR